MTILWIIGLLIWFVAGASALAWFFDWSTNPTRSALWLGPFALAATVWASVLCIGAALVMTGQL